MEISLYIDGEMHHCTTIDAASWASVLAHLSAAPHDGDTYRVATDFHAGRIIPGEIRNHHDEDEERRRRGAAGWQKPTAPPSPEQRPGGLPPVPRKPHA